MKKSYVMIILLCVITATFLQGCKSKESVGSVETIDRIYETHEAEDYTENGELILTSTEYRQVYLTDPGTYLIITFGDSGASSIQIVKDFGTQSAAVEYITDGGQRLIESGDYVNLNLNGAYVTYSPVMTNEKYGMYYRMSKAQAEAELSSTYVKQ